MGQLGRLIEVGTTLSQAMSTAYEHSERKLLGLASNHLLWLNIESDTFSTQILSEIGRIQMPLRLDNENKQKKENSRSKKIVATLNIKRNFDVARILTQMSTEFATLMETMIR